MSLLSSSLRPPSYSLIGLCVLQLTSSLWAQQLRAELPFPYHPNRVGAQAYAQGGAFVAQSGSVAGMLFNPASIAALAGKLAFTIEAGCNSRTEYQPFFNDTFSKQTHLVQFAGVAIVPRARWAVGAYFFQPTDYELDFGEFAAAGASARVNEESLFARRQLGFGINLARKMSATWQLGLGVEWRRAEVRDEVLGVLARGDAHDIRFALGGIVQVRDWQIGAALHSEYKAASDALFTYNDQRTSERMHFSAKEPASIRVGFVSPALWSRLRVSGDAEYKNFANSEPIPRGQFYGGTTLKLSSQVELAAGVFTFRKDYSAFVDGPRSEVFLTGGGTLKFGGLHLTISYMEGDVLNENFEGQRFVNLAAGMVLR